MKFNRRDFLLLSGGIVLANSKIVSAKPRKKIIVAGAGLSGLSAAYELASRGYQVTVIEGRNRVGGRVFTLKEPFLDGQYAEYGGELIGNGYKRMLAYANKFKVPYEEVPWEFETGGSVTNLQGGIGTTAILKETLYPIGSVLEPHPYNLKGDEAKSLPPALLARNIRQMLREVGENTQKLNELDKISLADTLRARGVSETALKLINISLNYNSIETVSAGGVLFEMQRRMSAGATANRVINGNFEIPKAFLKNAKLKGVKFIFQAKIKQISHTSTSVKVSFQDKNGKLVALEADKLVCTIPFSVLRDVRFSPSLPEVKNEAINNLDYTKVTKVFMQGDRFEWDSRNVGSSVWTDTALERIFVNAGTRGDNRGIFTVWTEGESSFPLEKMNDEVRQNWTKTQFESVLPFMKNSIERTAIISWTNDEFAKGSYATFKKGQFVSLKPHLKTQVGAIHFAGEHTAEFAPGMEGALESAERVVKEIDG